MGITNTFFLENPKIKPGGPGAHLAESKHDGNKIVKEIRNIAIATKFEVLTYMYIFYL